MLWNSSIVALLLISLSGCSVMATEVCPVRQVATLQFVDVFDGHPKELATLMLDIANERSGYWQLGYIYDAGRFVTVRCKYTDGQTVDVALTNKVNRCDYTIDKNKILTVYCQ